MESQNHGVELTSTESIPSVGFGTWENTDPNQCATSVETALTMGYRHIDTAQIYGNEAAVGEGIANAPVDRDDIFLATKVWIDNLNPEDVIQSTYDSLDRLGTDYIDLLYVHWPAREYEPNQTLQAFDQLKTEDLINHIGVSNFPPDALKQAVDILDGPPLVNQVECHPMLPQWDLRDTCDHLDTQLLAYSPLARGSVFDLDPIREIADHHGVSPAQVSLAWLRQAGVPAIPKATSEAHIRDNWASRELNLDESEIDRINQIETRSRQVDPSFAPWK